MGIDIKFLGHTYHLGGPSKPRPEAEVSGATGQTKSGRRVSVASDTQPNIPKGIRAYTPKNFFIRMRTVYLDFTTGKKLGMGYKQATQDLKVAVKQHASPGDIRKILDRHTSDVSTLNTLLSQLPTKLQCNESVAHAVRLYVPELLIKEDHQSPSTPESVASGLHQLRQDHAEVTGTGSVGLQVSINQRLQNAPVVDLLLRGSSDASNERLRGAATVSLQGMVSFHHAKHLRQQLNEYSKLVADPQSTEAELTNMMYDLAFEVKRNETKQMPALLGGANSHYLTESQYQSVQSQAPKERVEISEPRVTPKAVRPAPAVPGQSVVSEQVKAMKHDHPDLTSDLTKIETHFLGLQVKRGVTQEHLQQLVLQYPGHAKGDWTAEQFIQLCDYAVEALRSNEAQNLDHALRVGYANLGTSE